MAIKKEYGYVPPKPPVKPANNDSNRGYVPPQPPVKPPDKTSTSNTNKK